MYYPFYLLLSNRKLFLLALLVGNTAGGLASRLAGSLALAAAAGDGALNEISGFDGLNSLHYERSNLNKNLEAKKHPHLNLSISQEKITVKGCESQRGKNSVSLQIAALTGTFLCILGPGLHRLVCIPLFEDPSAEQIHRVNKPQQEEYAAGNKGIGKGVARKAQ